MTLDDYDAVIDVHLRGTGYVTHFAWPVMYQKNWGRIVLTSSTSGIFGNFGQANYGASKMGMLGLMNVLAIEGASHNIKVNCLAPGAATRMTASVPGATFDPKDPPSERGPALVSPAVLYMCSEDAPSGWVMHAASGRFSRSQIFANEGVKFDADDATFENLMDNIEQATDMSSASGREPTRRG